VTDHRIGLSQHNIQGFMDGDLDSMIDALINAAQAEKLGKGAEE
jgi:peptide chain release factor 1